MPGCLQHHRHPLALLGGDLAEAEQLAEAEYGVQRAAQLVADAGQELALGLVGCPQRPVCVFQLSRAGEDLRIHLLGAQLQLLGQPLLLGLVVPEPYVFCDVLHSVDDVGEPAERAEDRRVKWAPVADLEPTAGRFWPSDVVPLHRHRVGHQIPAYPVQGAAQVRLT